VTLRTRRDRDLLWVTLADPERANALSPALIAELTAIYRRPLRDDGVRAVLLDAEGRNFSAGADLEHLRALTTAGEEENRRDSGAMRDLFAAVLHQEALTVALVQGACIAGGCGLATAHDFVVAAEDARFMYSEVRIGFVAALVATFLPLRLRGGDVRELLLFPRTVDARQALAIGLINRVAAFAERHLGDPPGRVRAEAVLRLQPGPPLLVRLQAGLLGDLDPLLVVLAGLFLHGGEHIERVLDARMRAVRRVSGLGHG